jgi:hypothetical protein
MTKERDLRDELLRQNGGSPQKGKDLRDKILAKHQAAVAGMKRLTIYSWILVGTGLAVAGIVYVWFPDTIGLMVESARTFVLVWQALLVLAIVLTISFYVRSRTLTMHQIQSSLALIEEHLRKMSEKE